MIQNDMSRRRLLGLGLGLGAAASLTLAGCGGGDSDSGPAAGNGGKEYTGPKVDLKLWNGFTGGDGDIFKTLVNQFNTEHQNIAVSVATYQWEDYYNKLPGAASSGNGPDIAVMHMDQLATFAARGVITELDDVAKNLELSEGTSPPPCGRAGSTTTSGTASRWTCTRWASTTTRPSCRRPASTRTSRRPPGTSTRRPWAS
ncbi:hypothetical protein GCM10027614_56180 [Micromonospora vulcania]